MEASDGSAAGGRRQDWVDGTELRDGWNQVVLAEDSVLGRLGFWLMAAFRSLLLAARCAAARTCDLMLVEEDREEQACQGTQGTQGRQGPDGRRVWALEGARRGPAGAPTQASRGQKPLSPDTSGSAQGHSGPQGFCR